MGKRRLSDIAMKPPDSWVTSKKTGITKSVKRGKKTMRDTTYPNTLKDSFADFRRIAIERKAKESKMKPPGFICPIPKCKDPWEVECEKVNTHYCRYSSTGHLERAIEEDLPNCPFDLDPEGRFDDADRLF